MAKRRNKSSRVKGLKKLCKQDNCCPVITISCKMVQPRAKKEHRTGRNPLTGETLARGYTVTVPQPPKKVCTVKAGSHIAAKNVVSDKAGKKVATLKRSLEARRCKVEVKSLGKS
jgi:hypothetical protein